MARSFSSSLSFNESQIRSLRNEFKKATVEVRPALDVALRNEVNQAAREARAAAPRDRPWLSTTDGLRVTRSVRYGLSYSIRSGKDPDGQSVGYRVVYGTSKMPPRDFVTQPMINAANRFNKKALLIAVRMRK